MTTRSPAQITARYQGAVYEIAITRRVRWYEHLSGAIVVATLPFAVYDALRLVRDRFAEEWVFFLVVLLPATLTFCLACYAWLWQTFGKEIIRIGSGTMSIKRDILGVGRVRTFPAQGQWPGRDRRRGVRRIENRQVPQGAQRTAAIPPFRTPRRDDPVWRRA